VFTAICSRTESGFTLRVLEDGCRDGDKVRNVVREHLDWGDFRPASAGHRLIDLGWIIRPDVRGPDRVNGWIKADPCLGEVWTVPVLRVEEVVGTF
jgi:hypothetical protein